MAIPQYKKTGLVLSLMAIQTSSLAATEVSEAPVLLPEIHVTEASTVDGSSAQGYRVTKVQRGLLGEGSAQDTPLSIYSVSTELIRNTQATNTTDALKYVPTVYANTGASQITPYFTIRGFSASTWTYNMAVDGMRSFDIYQPMEDKERIEVLSGASSFLYGVTSPAGMINYVTKPPVSKPLREITVGSYDHQLYSQIDLGGPLNQDRDINYRLNVGYADPGDAGIQHQTQEHYVFSGATDWQASTDTKLSIEADKSRRELKYAQALFMTTSAIGIPATPDTAKNWGAPYTGAVDTTSRIGSGIETHLNDIFTLRSKWRYSDVEREYYLNRITFQNSNLDYKWRADTQHKFHTTVKQANLYVDADFATGQAHHKLSLGGSFDDFDAGNNGYRSTTYSTVYPATLTGDPTYPVWSQPASGTSTAQQTRYATLTIADQISLGKYFDVMIGSTRARVQDAATATTAAGVQSTSSYDQHRTTPVASVSFKPIDTVTGYVTYTEGLQQGFTADSTTANAGQVFAPYVSKQSEAGVKSRVANINLTAAYFRISQANQYVDTITRIASQDGREVHRGWEFTATGKATERLTLTGGFTSLDAQIEKASTYVGNIPQGVPENMARLYAEYRTPWEPRLILTGGASHIGKVPWDAANTLFVSAVTVYDTGFRVQTEIDGRDTTLRFNVANLTDKDYWTTRSGILYTGETRTFSLSATIAF